MQLILLDTVALSLRGQYQFRIKTKSVVPFETLLGTFSPTYGL